MTQISRMIANRHSTHTHRSSRRFLVFGSALVSLCGGISGCGTQPTSTAGSTAGAARPGYVTGHASFADGRPIPLFDVSVGGYDAGSDNGVTDGASGSVGSDTGHDGAYAIQTVDSLSHTKPVNALVVQVSAQTKVDYKGQTFTMDLCPLDGKGDLRDAQGNGTFSAPGITRDFVLKISGLIPGKDDTTDSTRQNAYYGQRISVSDWDVTGPTLRGDEFKDGTLTFTLTPQGPLLDGSTGQTVTRQLPVSALGTEAAYLLDVPIGTYSVQAQVAKGGAVTPLSMHWAEGDQTYMPSVTLNPQPYPERLSVLTGADQDALEIKP